MYNRFKRIITGMLAVSALAGPAGAASSNSSSSSSSNGNSSSSNGNSSSSTTGTTTSTSSNGNSSSSNGNSSSSTTGTTTSTSSNGNSSSSNGSSSSDNSASNSSSNSSNGNSSSSSSDSSGSASSSGSSTNANSSSSSGNTAAASGQDSVSSYGFDISDSIKIGGTDAASADFIKSVLPNLYPAANQKVATSQVSSSFTAAYLDSKGLTLNQDYLVRVYFVGDTTSNQSTLGFTTNDSASSATTIFDEASTLANLKGDGLGSTNRTSKSPLQPGDFVDLGFFTAGTNLDFYLISQTPSGKAAGVYSTQQSSNVDGLRHAMALTSEGSSYLMIGFEDEKNAGDQDFNDVVFAIQFIAQGKGGNLGGVTAPEPSLALGSVFAFGLLAIQRRRKA